MTADRCRPASVWPICVFTPSWLRCGSRIEKRWHPSRGTLDLGPADTEQFLHCGPTLRPAILAWTESSAADRGTNELTLRDLKAMQLS
ncbi:hypothetical protein [Streptomyces sp. NPDC059455]|uniref:hypothetical protein n=1 Tax=Streptomyces sp. NPDC059455 TaxID=3346837 RepID=UPI00368CDF4E